MRRPALHHLAVAQHHHLVGQRAHDLEVVADEQIGELVALLQVAQQVDDLGLHAHVERRGRLVEHHETRLQDERARDRDPLALAAREFVRIAFAHAGMMGGVEPDLAQRIVDHPGALGRRADAVHLEALAHDLADRHARAERAEGVLEDDLHLAPQRPQIALGELLEVLAVEHDAAVALLQSQ